MRHVAAQSMVSSACTELCRCGELCENAPVLESDIEEGEEDDLPSMSLD